MVLLDLRVPRYDGLWLLREVEVLRLMAEGYGNRDIARSLFIGEGTAKNHVSAILTELGARDRISAVPPALRDGLLRQPRDGSPPRPCLRCHTANPAPMISSKTVVTTSDTGEPSMPAGAGALDVTRSSGELPSSDGGVHRRSWREL